MDRHMSALKRNRQNIKRKKLNRSQRSYLRRQLREANQMVESKNLDGLTKDLGKIKKTVDQTAAKKLIHKNAAARYKSRLSKKMNALAKNSPKDTSTTL